MKLSRIIAMTAAISITAGVFYNVGRSVDVNTANSSSIFGDIDGDGSISPMDASILLSYYAYRSTIVGTPISLEEYLAYGPSGPDSPSIPDDNDHPIDPSVKTDGKTFTIAAWNLDDMPCLIAQWKGLDYKDILDDLAYQNILGALAYNKIDGVRFIRFSDSGGNASEKYDRIFAAGDDLDVYFCEADWASKYINNDKRTLDLSKLGITDEDFSNIYSYTDEIGKASNGVRKGVSWNCYAGAYAYRADLAEEYLGAASPELMQSFVSDWDSFVSAATTVSYKTNGRVAMADSVGGMCKAYFCGKTVPWVIDGKLRLDVNGVQDFANKVKKLWNSGGVSHSEQWLDDWTTGGVDGSVMGYFVPTWGLDGFFLEASGGYKGAQYGKWAMCEGPQPYYWSGDYILVNPATDNGKEARDFILSAASDERQMKEYAVNKPEFVNNSAVMNELIANNTVFNEEIMGNFVNNQNIGKVFSNNAKAIDIKGVVTPYDSEIEVCIANGIYDYCVYDYTWSEIEDRIHSNVRYEYPNLY